MQSLLGGDDIHIVGPSWNPDGCILMFLHTFSAPRRHGDLQFWLEALGSAANIRVCVISTDILHGAQQDVLDDGFFSSLRQLCYSGRLFGYHGEPM